ncbi:hypothetical protein [Streptomyces aidingensis]|uniref:Uncharacterized protein n=1 Tax=Streptomyces aidingensis TaxID=910347 RepID=A0A1I1PYT8_9ACTN|nr:hypothetical protein [Streptomyces aidingensis]SFD12778.1 hypothetical protein SAMN05421773_11026 [Streptomyces aidingensis]
MSELSERVAARLYGPDWQAHRTLRVAHGALELAELAGFLIDPEEAERIRAEAVQDLRDQLAAARRTVEEQQRELSALRPPHRPDGDAAVWRLEQNEHLVVCRRTRAEARADGEYLLAKAGVAPGASVRWRQVDGRTEVLEHVIEGGDWVETAWRIVCEAPEVRP